ncbi:hypothetical protein ABZ092_25935 [Streptomyces bobili]
MLGGDRVGAVRGDVGETDEGVLFGTVFVLIAEASTTVAGLFLALFVQRVTNVLTGGAALYAAVRRGAPALPEGGLPWPRPG